jgi:hypothetical protein
MPAFGPVSRYWCPSCGETTLTEELVRDRRTSILRGAGPSTAPVSIPQATRTPLSATSTNGAQPFNSPAVTVVTGSTLVVALQSLTTGFGSDGVTWNGIAMTLVHAHSVSNSDFGLYVIQNVPATATAAVSADFSSFGDSSRAAMIVTMLTSVPAASLDKKSVTNGTGTTVTAAATGPLGQQFEIALVFVGFEGPSTDGAETGLAGGFSDGQTAGTSGGLATSNETLREYFRFITSGADPAFNAIFPVGRDWNASTSTYMDLS